MDKFIVLCHTLPRVVIKIQNVKQRPKNASPREQKRTIKNGKLSQPWKERETAWEYSGVEAESSVLLKTRVTKQKKY